MADHDFLFSVDVPAPGAASDSMLADLLPRVLCHVGCGPDVLAELLEAVRQVAVESDGAQVRCDVQFQAHDKQLEISVTVAGRVWRTSRPIP